MLIPVFVTILAAVSTPSWAWELSKRDGAASAAQRSGDLVASISCSGRWPVLSIDLTSRSADYGILAAVPGITLHLIQPDGSVERVPVTVMGEGPSLNGQFPPTARTMQAFANGAMLRITRTETGQLLFESDMKGTGAARIAFAERCNL